MEKCRPVKRSILSPLSGALLMAALSSLHSQTFNNTLLPQPAHLTAAAGALPWTSAITVGAPRFRDQRLDQAIARTLEQIERKTGVPRQRELTRDAAAA